MFHDRGPGKRKDITVKIFTAHFNKRNFFNTFFVLEIYFSLLILLQIWILLRKLKKTRDLRGLTVEVLKVEVRIE